MRGSLRAARDLPRKIATSNFGKEIFKIYRARGKVRGPRVQSPLWKNYTVLAAQNLILGELADTQNSSWVKKSVFFKVWYNDTTIQPG